MSTLKYEHRNNCKKRVRTIKDQKKNFIVLAIFIFASYFIFGISENIKGPAIPLIQADFSLSEGNLGLLMSLNSIGYLLACSFSGWFARKTGLKFSGVLCLSVMAVGGLLMAVSPSYLTFSGSYFLMYIGNGMLEIVLGIMAAKIFTERTGTMLNLSHFFYGLSSMLAPLFATWLISMKSGGGTLGWRGMYAVALSLSLLPILFVFFARFPKMQEEHHEHKTPFKEYIKNPISWLVIGILSFGVITEMSIGGWLVNYLEKSFSFSNTAASAALSGFFLCFMLARLLFGPVIDRIGLAKSLIFVTAFACVMVVLGVLLGQSGVVLLSVAGFGIGPIYPTVMAVIAKVFKSSLDATMSFTLTVMGLLTVAANALIGFIIDLGKSLTAASGAEASVRSGYFAGFLFLELSILLCFAGTIDLYRRLKRKNELV